jgi:hypothetical protein
MYMNFFIYIITRAQQLCFLDIIYVCLYVTKTKKPFFPDRPCINCAYSIYCIFTWTIVLTHHLVSLLGRQGMVD